MKDGSDDVNRRETAGGGLTNRGVRLIWSSFLVSLNTQVSFVARVAYQYTPGTW